MQWVDLWDDLFGPEDGILRPSTSPTSTSSVPAVMTGTAATRVHSQTATVGRSFIPTRMVSGMRVSSRLTMAVPEHCPPPETMMMSSTSEQAPTLAHHAHAHAREQKGERPGSPHHKGGGGKRGGTHAYARSAHAQARAHPAESPASTAEGETGRGAQGPTCKHARCPAGLLPCI